MTKNLANHRRADGPKYCPRCTTMMVLDRVAPKFARLPELRSYKCLECGCVVKEEIQR